MVGGTGILSLLPKINKAHFCMEPTCRPVAVIRFEKSAKPVLTTVFGPS